jgi:hypothetical protein
MAYESTYELKAGQGSLFATKSKTNPKSPDYFGEILIDINSLEIVNGQAKIKLGGWKIKSEKSGNTFLSLKIDTWKPDQQAQPQQQDNGGIDDDIPF